MISKKLFPITIFIYFFQYASERNLNYFNFWQCTIHLLRSLCTTVQFRHNIQIYASMIKVGTSIQFGSSNLIYALTVVITFRNVLWPKVLGIYFQKWLLWADLGQSLLVGVKDSKWSQISHSKLNISIWVSSILVKSPKDHLLRRGLDYSALPVTVYKMRGVLESPPPRNDRGNSNNAAVCLESSLQKKTPMQVLHFKCVYWYKVGYLFGYILKNCVHFYITE